MMAQGLVLLVLTCMLRGTTLAKSTESKQRPNIVFFLADDLGRTDVGFTEGNFQTPTPTIDRLAWEGLILNRYYSDALCTPTRGSLLTGKYTIHTGLQNDVIRNGIAKALPLQHTLLPQLLKKLGYRTNLLGKARGFDYSLWYSSGSCHFLTYSAAYPVGVYNSTLRNDATSGKDFTALPTSKTEGERPATTSGRTLRENGLRVPVSHVNNFYLPELLNAKAEEIIRDTDPAQPFFLYFATPLPHTSNSSHLTTMPQFDLRPSVRNFPSRYPKRKQQLALIQALDESVKRMIDALTNKGVLNNTIFVFASDNGGAAEVVGPLSGGANHGYNWPLRAGKASLFEGGVRTAAFIWSPLLKRPATMTNQLFHVTDWLPTLWHAAEGNMADLDGLGIDGVSQWSSLQSGTGVGPRKDVLHNIDSVKKHYALTFQAPSGNLFKVLGGSPYSDQRKEISWFAPENTKNGRAKNWRKPTVASIRCKSLPAMAAKDCIPWERDCLFDLTDDPCEAHNIAVSRPDILLLLQHKLESYNATAVPALVGRPDLAANPDLWNGWFVPWQDQHPWDEGVPNGPLFPTGYYNRDDHDPLPSLGRQAKLPETLRSNFGTS